jgi:hypothetical protein
MAGNDESNPGKMEFFCLICYGKLTFYLMSKIERYAPLKFRRSPGFGTGCAERES